MRVGNYMCFTREKRGREAHSFNQALPIPRHSHLTKKGGGVFNYKSKEYY